MTLKVGSAEDIQRMFENLQDQAEGLIDSIIEMSYFMRGSMSYESILLTMSYAERQLVSEFLKRRLETESKSPRPVY